MLYSKLLVTFCLLADWSRLPDAQTLGCLLLTMLHHCSSHLKEKRTKRQRGHVNQRASQYSCLSRAPCMGGSGRNKRAANPIFLQRDRPFTQTTSWESQHHHRPSSTLNRQTISNVAARWRGGLLPTFCSDPNISKPKLWFQSGGSGPLCGSSNTK